MADVMRRWISAPIRSRAARTAGSAPPPATPSCRRRQPRVRRRPPAPGGATPLHPGGHGVVDVGEVGNLPDQVEVDLGDQVVLRREVGVGGGRGDFGARRHGAHRQVGVGSLAQHLQAGRQHLAEGFLLAAVARRAPVWWSAWDVTVTSASLDTCPSYRIVGDAKQACSIKMLLAILAACERRSEFSLLHRGHHEGYGSGRQYRTSVQCRWERRRWR